MVFRMVLTPYRSVEFWPSFMRKPFFKPIILFVQKDKDYLETNQFDKIAENQSWKKMEYSGCPAHYGNSEF